MAGTVATRIAVLDAIKKLHAKKTPWPKIVKHLNKNGLHPGSRRRWTHSALIKYWHKYHHLLDQKTKVQAERTAKRMETLRKKYPRHQILSHSEVEREVCALRWNAEGEWGWASVAKQLNKRRIIHEDWRARTAKWNKESVRSYAKRRKLSALSVDEPVKEEVYETKALSMPKPTNGTTRKVEINFQETSNEHQITGSVQLGTDPTTATVRFTYEGALTAATREYLQTLQLLP